MRSSLWIPAVAPSVVGVFFMVFSSSVLAQITPDGTLGSEGSIVLPDQVVKDLPADLIQGGAVRGSNLFHSFLEFNVNEGQRVYFENPTGIDRILSRVTGSDVSDILGTLGVNGGADLFFLNPNGIIFGPNARLDIRGSFTASTGSAFTFSDGSEFRTVDPNAPPLLTVNVIPGVRYGALAEATLINNGQLQVGRDLTLGAPRLELGGGSLQAGRDLVLQGTQRLLAGGSYTVGGYLFTQDLAGNTIDVVVPHSNLIWGTGDVQFTENYSGESLYVLAGGAVSAGDGVNSLQITGGGAETINATLQDGQAITVSSDGKKRLDIRSGVDWTALLGSSPVNSGLGVNFNGATTSDINLAAVDIDTSSSSSVGVSGDGDQLVEAIGGDVRLMALENIAVKSINTSASVELEGTVPSGTVATFTGRAVAGDIDLEAGGDINTGSLQASGSSTVTITPEITTDGDIVIGGNAGGITEIVAAQGGNIALEASQSITTGSIDSSASADAYAYADAYADADAEAQGGTGGVVGNLTINSMGGAIDLNAGESITTGNLDASADASADAYASADASADAYADIGAYDDDSAEAQGGTGGIVGNLTINSTGGTIELNAGKSITTGNLDSSADADAYASADADAYADANGHYYATAGAQAGIGGIVGNLTINSMGGAIDLNAGESITIANLDSSADAGASASASASASTDASASIDADPYASVFTDAEAQGGIGGIVGNLTINSTGGAINLNAGESITIANLDSSASASADASAAAAADAYADAYAAADASAAASAAASASDVDIDNNTYA